MAHETHRGRYLCCPFATARLLGRVPSLRLTADLSHWVLKTERLLDAPEEARLLGACIAPAVDHLHARLGAPQLPQLSDPRDPRHALAAAQAEHMAQPLAGAFSQLALPRLLSAPDRAPGCPGLRPASANEQVGPHSCWPARIGRVAFD